MQDQSKSKYQRNNRRTFLQTIGVAMGSATLGSTSISAEETTTDDKTDSSEWTTARSNQQRTGAIADTGPTSPPTINWKMDLEGGMLSKEPIIANNTAYLAITTENESNKTSGFIGAYNIETGSQQWRQSAIPSPKTPIIDGQTLYFATNDPENAESSNGGIYALNVETGDIEWSRTDLLRWTSPIITKNRIYTSNEQAAYTLEKSTGNTVWSTNRLGKQIDSSDGALSYADGTIFFSNGTALNASDGSVKWQITEEESTFGNHVIDNGRVFYLKAEYIENHDDTITVDVRSADDGSALWTHTIDNKRTLDRRFAVADGHVLFYNSEAGDTVTALDAKTGTHIWTTELSGEFFSNLSVANGTIYLGGRYRDPSTPVRGQPIIYAIDLQTGDQQWNYRLDSSGLETSPEVAPAAGTPVITDGQLYAATYPAGSMLDYQYIYYANFFAFN